MAQHRFLIAGARGGQGATTIATVVAALAAGHQPTTLVANRPGDVCALTGTPIPPKWHSVTSICPNLHLDRHHRSAIKAVPRNHFYGSCRSEALHVMLTLYLVGPNIEHWIGKRIRKMPTDLVRHWDQRSWWTISR